MTIQELIFLLKEGGKSDNYARVQVCAILTMRGYRITGLTRCVIDRHLNNYAQFNQQFPK